MVQGDAGRGDDGYGGARRAWMAVLARTSRAQAEAALDAAGGPPPHEPLKGPEAGAIMVEGRAGGTGHRFALGEVTATRCVLRLADGTLGHAYALGRDLAHARACALLDALLQHPARGPALNEALVAPLARAQAGASELASREAASSRVEFFTLVRAEG